MYENSKFSGTLLLGVDVGIFKLHTASLTPRLSFIASNSLIIYIFSYLLNFSSDFLTSPFFMLE